VEVYAVKPGGILYKSFIGTLLSRISWKTVKVDVLASVMTDLFVNGGSENVVLNKAIVQKSYNIERGIP